jgi:L-fuculose-phosphate aldolase
MVAVAGGDRIALAEYALFGTPELSANVLAALGGGRRAALMAHHGQVTHGITLAEAMELAFEVEELAAQYILFRSLGTGELLSKAQMAKVRERFAQYRRAGAGPMAGDEAGLGEEVGLEGKESEGGAREGGEA